MIFNEFCKEQNCEHYIEWEYNNDVYDEPIRCFSCKLIGQSHNINKYPDNCKYLNEIKILYFSTFKKFDKGFYMMATKAIHLLDDISRDEPDLCFIKGEDEDGNWIGQWCCGLGFGSVKFPKETTRKLTQKEIDYWESNYFTLNGYNTGKIKIN